MSLLFLSGCGFDFPDSAKLSLDYHIDRTRLVAISINPPVLQPDTPVTLEVLYLDPVRTEPQRIRWELCGLRDDVWVINYGLDCFEQSELVTQIGDSNPISWSPTPSDAFCSSEDCAHYVPLLVTVEPEAEPQRVSTMVEVYGEKVWTDEDLALPTLRDQGVALQSSEEADGRIYLQAAVDGRFEDLQWRWYVDGGVLEKTGRTQTQGSRAGGLWELERVKGQDARHWSDNVWELPDEPGIYRAVVVVGGRLGWSEGKEGKDTGKEGQRAERNWLYGANPDQTWAITEVEKR